ncbi:hypothetical protein X735_09865 [Mesorhizobium sp. L2C085B000]|uniref:phage tail tape measure protein n=1 Tax=Mesorhizobium sp. L2C085B000 TaxID=1287117 RepID=UPI0003CFD5A0|nr:phage tail tape measure protein [Mesorhizobium sp. L2C085B000]ESZ17694.1 hypothetical protein X735_09865 [Mesorhizobium sp. L2C085B000]
MAATIKQRIQLDGGKELKRELEEFGAAGRKAFRDLQSAAAQTKGLSPGFFNSLKQAQVQLQSLGKQFGDVGKKAQDLGKTFSTHLTLPIVGLGAGILKQAADFQTAMNSFVANTGAAGDAFDQAKAKAIELGNASVFSATDSANAMTELAKIGLEYSQIMDGAAKATLDLAAANGGQLVPAAGIAGDLIKQFNLQVKQLPGVVDNVTGTLIKSKLGFDDYRLAIGQTGGVASALGVSLADMNTALAGTSNLFSSGSDAGTSFKTFLQRLVPQSKQAAAVFKELNLQFFDSRGKMKSLADISEELRLKMGKLSQEDLNDKGSTIFGTDALRTAIGLMKLGGAGFRQLAADIGTVGASKLAEVRVQGLTGELNKFNSAVETLSIAIGDSGLLEFVTSMVVKLTEFTTALSKLNPETLRLGTEIGAVAAAIGPALIALGLFGRGIGFVLGGIGTLIQAVRGLGAALLFLRANPLLAALSVIAGGIALWATRTDSATAALEVHEGILANVRAAYDKVKGAATDWAKVIEHTTALQAVASLTALTAAAVEARKAMEFAGPGPGAADALTGPVRDQVVALRDLALEFVKTGGDVDAFKAKVQAIADASTDGQIQALALGMQNAADKFRDTETAASQAKDVVIAFKGSAAEAQAAMERLTGKTKDSFKPIIDGTKDANAAIDGTKGKVEQLGQTITVFRGGGAGGKLTKEVFDVVDGVAKRAEEGKQALDGLKGSVDATSGAVDGVSNEITNSISTIAPAAQEAASGFNSSLGNLDAGAAQAAAEAIVAPFETLPGKLSAILSGMRALLQGGFSGLAGIVNSLAAQVEAAIARILASLRAAAAAAQSLRAAAGSSSSSDGGGSHGGFARGGHLSHGPGTGTSDSILARLSVGEFVIRAKVVKALGADFFAALNAGVMPDIDAFRSLSKGFSLGGIADGLTRGMAVQRFAGGGPARMQLAAASTGNNRTPVILQLPGGEQIDDLTIGDIALNRLQQFLIQESYASNGRRPRR